MNAKFTSWIITIIFTGPLFGQAGKIDSTFNGKGKVLTDFGTKTDVINQVAVQADGKILCAGVSGVWPNLNSALVRYNANGSLDNSFGKNGIVTSDLGVIDQAHGIALQKDRKIIIAGGGYSFHIQRYSSSGGIDYSFGKNGLVVTDFDGDQCIASAIAIQPDEKIVVVGSSEDGINTDFVLARYNVNGTLDSSFGMLGKVKTDIGSNGDYPTSVVIQKDGKIVLCGYNNDFILVRYKSNGQRDSTLGKNGIVITKFGATYSYAMDLEIQADSKIVVGGLSNDNGKMDFALARYLSNGTLDSSFNFDGKVLTDFNGQYDNAYGVAIQTDGKIILGGTSNEKIAIARYKTDGTLDVTWGNAGKVNDNFNGGEDAVNSVILLPGDKLLIAGSSFVGGDNDFAIAKYFTSTKSAGVTTNDGIQKIVEVFPNPAGNNLNIKYKIDEIQEVTIKINNINGQTIAVLLAPQNQVAGNHHLVFDLPSDMLSGIYFLEIITGKKSYGFKLVK